MSKSLWLVRGASLGVVIGALVLASDPAYACSICRCGDPTFNALGKDGFSGRGFRLAFDTERFDKEQGAPGGEQESVVENRFTLLGSYGLGERVTLFARLPFSSRRLEAIEDETETLKTSGFSDPEAYGQVVLWASGLARGVGRRSSLSALAGVKTSWGRNDLERDGIRLDEHAQAGTGSTDVFGGLSGLYLFNKESALFTSVQYRRAGASSLGYRYGNSTLANLAYEHKLGSRLDGVVELNFRHAGRDQVDASGERDPDTGGTVVYLTPRLLINVGSGLVLRVAVQIPVVRDLYGDQKERAVVNAGVTYLFGTR